MAKTTNHFPSFFSKIAEKTIRLGTWQKTLDNPQSANSLRPRWYSYVAALKESTDYASWTRAVRVIISVKESTITFTDRDTGPLAQAFEHEFDDEPLTDFDKGFADVMRLKQKQAETQTTNPSPLGKEIKTLTEEDILVINQLLKSSHSEQVVAASFGVDVVTIQQVREKEAN